MQGVITVYQVVVNILSEDIKLLLFLTDRLGKKIHDPAF